MVPGNPNHRDWYSARRVKSPNVRIARIASGRVADYWLLRDGIQAVPCSRGCRSVARSNTTAAVSRDSPRACFLSAQDGLCEGLWEPAVERVEPAIEADPRSTAPG